MTTRRRRDVETHDMGSAEPGGATETRAPVNSDALTTCSELEPTEAAGGDWRELALCL